MCPPIIFRRGSLCPKYLNTILGACDTPGVWIFGSPQLKFNRAIIVTTQVCRALKHKIFKLKGIESVLLILGSLEVIERRVGIATLTWAHRWEVTCLDGDSVGRRGYGCVSGGSEHGRGKTPWVPGGSGFPGLPMSKLLL